MMIRAIAIGFTLAFFAACSPPETGAEAGPGEASAQTGANAPAGADEAINAWYREQFGANLIEPVSIAYGDFSGDGAVDALAWAYYATGGSGGDTHISLWRNENGAMVFMRSPEDVFGEEPRDIQIRQGGVTLTTSVPRDGDPRCCPTGERTWTIDAN